MSSGHHCHRPHIYVNQWVLIGTAPRREVHGGQGAGSPRSVQGSEPREGRREGTAAGSLTSTCRPFWAGPGGRPCAAGQPRRPLCHLLLRQERRREEGGRAEGPRGQRKPGPVPEALASGVSLACLQDPSPGVTVLRGNGW